MAHENLEEMLPSFMKNEEFKISKQDTYKFIKTITPKCKVGKGQFTKLEI